jgi:biotin transport system substrate-specific component
MERNITLIALFAALTAALALAPKIDLISGVPITAQSLGIMLSGTVLGKRNGALAVLLYLLLAAIGLPILAGGSGGLGVFFGPTAGFLIGFPVAAFVAGLVVEKWAVPVGVSAFAGAALGGIVVLYIFGIAGMAITLNKTVWEASLFATPFLIGDLVKAVIAALVTQALYRMRPGVVLSKVVRA